MVPTLRNDFIHVKLPQRAPAPSGRHTMLSNTDILTMSNQRTWNNANWIPVVDVFDTLYLVFGLLSSESKIHTLYRDFYQRPKDSTGHFS